MPKQFPNEIKLKAMELFLDGSLTAKEIADEVSTEEHVVSPPTTVSYTHLRAHET